MAPKPRHGPKTTLKTNRFVSSNPVPAVASRDEFEPPEDINYTVHLPPTPDNQPMKKNQYRNREEEEEEEQVDSRLPPQYVSATLFTGGFNSMTRGQLIERMVDSNKVVPGAPVFCAVDGCDNSTLDSNGNAVLPCYCDFTICGDCYMEAMDAGGLCPGCKEPFHHPSESATIRLPLPAATEHNQSCSIERQLSVVQRSGNMRVTHTNNNNNNRVDFDHVSWLFETKGTYGYGNALWPKDGSRPSYEGEIEPGLPIHNKETSRRPLCRKVKVPGAIISPYRLLVVVRLVVLGFFLTWRILHPNKDATWLWATSVVCELWFAVSWVLDQLPKLFPINRATDLNCLRDKFESLGNDGKPLGISDLPGIDVFVSTADPEKEPPFTTANTVLSILAVDYPAEKLSCYVSDDGGALWTFEALAEAASFARIWVPFCRKHKVEPRNPETYFSLRGDPTKNKVRTDFVRDRRRMKREYDEFKVRINNLRNSIRRRSEAYNAREEMKTRQAQIEHGMDLLQPLEVPPGATWMSDGTHWPGTWAPPSKDHSRQDHAGIIQVMLPPPSSEACYGGSTNVDDEIVLDSTGVDIRLPMLVYVSREKRPGYDHNKKAGAMNALVRSSAIMSNGPFILNLDCDHYVYNSTALREGICFMMDRGGDNVCFVQFPQRFEGIDPNDRYANHNTVFFDGNMRALDGLQGPMYVGTGCMFRRSALYGFDPPRFREYGRCFGCCSGRGKHEPGISLVTAGNQDNNIAATSNVQDTEDSGEFGGAGEERIKHIQLNETVEIEEEGGEDNMERMLLPKMFGSSAAFIASIPVAEFGGRPLAEHPGVRHGRPAGALRVARTLLHPATVAEAISVISCWYEHKSEWGNRVGWIYGSVTEDVVTGFRMHNRGWRSIYCVTKRDAFRGTAPINLTDRLHQVLRWATGSVEIFFSRNNGMLAGTRMKILQRVAYLNVGIYPFTSVFLLVYCFLPAVCLFADQFIVQRVDSTFLAYLLAITTCLCLLAILEVKWAGITLEEWWRNEQFWLICGTSAHVAAVLQGLLKVMAGIDISFTLTSKAASEDDEDGLADLYVVKWTSLMIPPITIMMINLISIAVGMARTVYSRNPQWNKLFGGVFFSLWVLVHLYPFAKGLMGRRGRTPTVVWVWSGLLAITISLLWVAITPPSNPLRDGIPSTYNGMIHIP